ncbi:lipopolysaccharide 3-alpha-galactosyltransferase [Sinirhodobacter ferrireducens]|uniref:Lipopolysaccharide 3-alpha-galactosyltransferase n=1 Tax=Paenirhodobacter ferrireducens TaxID=1215032 RepID=A0A443LBX1_9RHOB|nr:glycosyltransferase [Sinirhodobacter ferrireducens]RWR46615.1 lipopolysaccharide 3-alpha-galactosyltransferase [Sinirhodobacter ferrireducens]
MPAPVSPPPEPRIVYVTDAGLLKPTLVSLWSLLEHLSTSAEVQVWGDGLSTDEWEAVHRVAKVNPRVTLVTRALSAEMFAGARSPAAHISAAAMGRLFIPRHLSGRVLYIDGDTLICGDVSPLFATEFGGGRIAGVRDYLISKWIALGQGDTPSHIARITDIRRNAPPEGYINSGILLLDCDSIREAPGLLARLEDVAAASAARWGDQDHLNFLFAGCIHHLNPAWNASWSRTGDQRRFIRALGGTPEELAPRPAAIMHFHGPKKPWKAPRFDLWSRRARAVWHYRRELRRFRSLFPDLVP